MRDAGARPGAQRSAQRADRAAGIASSAAWVAALTRPDRSHFRDGWRFAAAVASEVAAPLLRGVARAVVRAPATPVHAWRKALIVGHGHIGDVLCQTVSLPALARGLAQCELSYLTTPLAAEALAGNPALHHVLPWNWRPRPDAVSREHLAALRAERFDAVICTSAFRPQEGIALALRIRAPNRAAFAHKGLSGLVTLPVALQGPCTVAEQSRTMAAMVTGTRDNSELRPHMYPTADDERNAAIEFARLTGVDASVTVACSITTRQKAGKVPPEFFLEVLRPVLQRRPDWRIILAGSLADAPVLRQVADALGPRATVSAGTLSIIAFAALLRRCNAFFGMDSGPRHIANAMRTPVVFVRNLGVPAAEAGAYCPTELDAAPSQECLDDAGVRAVLSRIDRSQIADEIITRAQGRRTPD